MYTYKIYGNVLNDKENSDDIYLTDVEAKNTSDALKKAKKELKNDDVTPLKAKLIFDNLLSTPINDINMKVLIDNGYSKKQINNALKSIKNDFILMFEEELDKNA